MKIQHSDSLIIVWRVAEVEARHLNASVIEPTHLLLGLCKMVDLDLPELLSKNMPNRDEVLEELLREVRRIKNALRMAGLDAKVFRRSLRRASAHDELSLVRSESMRRSKTAKQVFADAERMAILTGHIVYPAHLLYAVLLNKDEARDEVLNGIGVTKRRVLEMAKREVLFEAPVVAGRKYESRRN